MIAAFLDERDERHHASVLHKLRIFDSAKFGQVAPTPKKITTCVKPRYSLAGASANVAGITAGGERYDKLWQSRVASGLSYGSVIFHAASATSAGGGSSMLAASKYR